MVKYMRAASHERFERKQVPQYTVNSRKPSTHMKPRYHFSAPFKLKALAEMDFADFPPG